MKMSVPHVLALALFVLTMTACGPSQAEMDSTATQAAADMSGTQTAQAPTVTPTYTPSPTATATPTVTPTPTSTPTIVPPSTPLGGGSKIAFSSNRDGNFEIYMMNSDGTHQTQLTNSPTTEDWWPELFPDGEVMLYWSYAADEPPIARLNWLMSDGSGQGIFVNIAGAYSSVSMDGQVAITMFDGKGGYNVGSVNLGSGEIVQLTDHPEKDFLPDWSPDGSTIIFVSYRDGPPHIYLMDWEGSNQRRLTDSELNETEPDWSPDGTTIAFLVIDETTTSNIYLVNADGTNIRPLTNEEGSYNENPVWSPDGTMIAFWSNRTGNSEIYAIRLDGSGLVNLTNNPGEDQNPSWSK